MAFMNDHFEASGPFSQGQVTCVKYGFAFAAHKALARTVIEGLWECLIHRHRIPYSVASNVGTHFTVTRSWQMPLPMGFTGCSTYCNIQRQLTLFQNIQYPDLTLGYIISLIIGCGKGHLRCNSAAALKETLKGWGLTLQSAVELLNQRPLMCCFPILKGSVWKTTKPGWPYLLFLPGSHEDICISHLCNLGSMCGWKSQGPKWVCSSQRTQQGYCRTIAMAATEHFGLTVLKDQPANRGVTVLAGLADPDRWEEAGCIYAMRTVS